MASKSSIAIRKEAALEIITRATGADLTMQAKDADTREVMLLEAIAAAVTTAAAETADVGTTADALPAGFPGRDALAAAGYTTAVAVRAVADLTAITGIGKATAAAITEALTALPADTAANDGAAA